MQPQPKRQLRPAPSVPTTAEHYGEFHGIRRDVQDALPNIGMRIRQSVTNGRSFDRTQSHPSITTSVLPSPSIGLSGFQTNADITNHAQSIISKEAMKAGELQPYGSTAVDNSSLSPGGPSRSSSSDPKLRFSVNGDIDMDGRPDINSSIRPSLALGSGRLSSRGEKRRTEDGTEEDGSDTELDEGDVPEMQDVPGLSVGGSGSTVNDDFPPVFVSPQITQPELFARPALPSRPMKGGREVRGLPGGGSGRMLGKTVSAPVFGTGGGGMEVEDGFDVSEWAKDEAF